MEGHADSFSSIMASGTGFDGHAMVSNAVDRNGSLSRALNGVDQQVTGFVFGDRRIVAFVKAFVAVGDVAG